METARFLVSLTRSENGLCRVERTVRRKDKSRAVFHAQMWLLKTQPLEKYFGVTYNMYEIFEQDDSGQWVRVEIGGVTDAEIGRSEAREAMESSQTQSVPRKGQRVEGSKAGNTQARKGRSTPRAATFFGASVKRPRVKTLSPLQQRIADAKQRAREIIAEKKAKGET